MKIIQLTAENFKRLKVVEIRPDGALVQITGKNASGKSSTLDAIYAALAGADAAPKQPVRKGEQSARIRLDLGEYVVTRKFDADGGTSLRVEAASGARVGKAQTTIDGLLGAISFDPLEFSRMKPADQYETLRGIVKIDVDIDALDGLNQRDHEDRTEVNRRAKSLRAQASAIFVPDGLPAKTIDTATLLTRMTEAGEGNALIERRKANRQTVADKIAADEAAAGKIEAALPGQIDAIAKRAEGRVTRIEAQIKELQDELAGVRAQAEQDAATVRDDAANRAAELRRVAADMRQKLEAAEPLAEPVDVAALRVALDEAQRVNKLIEARDRRAAIEADAAKVEAESEQLTANMAERTKAKEAAITAAKMPVPGLGFGAKQITFNGLPFDQASSAEQLRVSVAIAMAANPRLRVLRIKEGSLLDEDGLRLIEEMAVAADYQCWIERVDSSGKIGIVMEDGAVKVATAPELPLSAAQ